MTNNSFKKNLLATASAFAIGAFAAGVAGAAQQTTAGNENLSADGIAEGVVFGGDHTLTVTAAQTAVGATGGVSFTSDGTDNHGTIVLDNTGTLSIAGALGATAANNQLLLLTVNTSATTNFAANTFVETMNFAADGTLVFASGVNVNNSAEIASGAITSGLASTTVGRGTLTYSGGAQTTKGAVGTGTNYIKAINAGATGATTTFTGNVFAVTTNVTGTGTVAFNGNANGTTLAFAADGAVTMGDDDDLIMTSITATGAGTTGRGTITMNSQSGNVLLSGNLGTTTDYIKEVTFAHADNKTVTNGDLYVATIDFNNIDTELDVVNGKNIAGVITSGGNGVGTVTLVGATTNDTTITGAIGSSTALDLLVLNHTAGLDGSVLTLNGADNFIVTTNVGAGQVALNGNLTGNVNFTAAAGATGKLTVATGKTVTGNATSADNPGEGIVEFAGAGTWTGDIGVAGANEIGAVTINAGAVAVSGDVAALAVNFAADGSLSIANNKTLEAAVTNTTTGQGTVTFLGIGTMTGALGATTDILKLVTVGNGAVTANSNVYATTLNFAGDNTFTSTGNGSTISAAVTTATTNTGTLAYQHNTTQTGNVGTSTKLLKLVQIDSNNTDGETVTVNGDIFATTVTFVGNSTLALADNSDVTAAITATNTEGTINFAGSSTVTGTVGTNAARIGTININSTDTTDVISFTDNVFVDVFDAETGGSSVATIRIAAGKSITDTSGITAAEIGNGTYDFGVQEVAGGTDLVGQIITTAGTVDMTGAKAYVRVSSASDFIATGNTYTIVDAAGAGAVGPDSVTDNSYILSFASSVSGNDIIVTATRENTYDDTSTLSTGAQAFNINAVGDALEAIANAGDDDLDAIQGELSAMSTAAEINAALATLNPDMSGAITAGAVAAADAGFRAIDERVDELASVSGATVATGGSANKSGVWGKVFGTSADQDWRDGVAGYQADTLGFGIGGDTAINDQARVGAALAYANTSADSANGDADIDSYQITGYGTYDYGKWYSEALLGFTHNNFDVKRNVVVGAISDQAKADFDGQQYTAKIGAGYKLNVEGGLNVTPVASLKYDYITFDKYTETGSSANLAVDNDSLSSLKSNIGVKLNYPIVNGGLTYIPEISAGWTYDFIGDEQESTNNFTGASSTLFTTKGADVAQSALNVGLGLDVLAQDNVTVSFDYDWTNKADYNAHSGAVKARFAF